MGGAIFLLPMFAHMVWAEITSPSYTSQ